MSGNVAVRWLLCSPLHFLLSGSTLLLRYCGRHSGQRYVVPVNYVQRGSELLIISFRSRVWWRNLRGGAEVGVRLRGVERTATAVSLEEDTAVAACLADYLRARPQWARYFDVSVDSQGAPELSDVATAATSRVSVRLTLDPEV